MKKNIILLIAIVILAFVLRFYNLGVTPPSPDWDEAALGYNAYSILQTGRDEYGYLLPLSLRSFNDYKPPLYMYLSIPSVAVFGLNLFGIRFPSVVMGTITVLGVYFLTKELFRRFKNESEAEYLAILTAFLLAISPWHLQFSRIAFEVNSSLMVIVWGTVFFFWGLRKRIFLPFSAVFMALSLYAYHSARVFVPILLIAEFFLFKKELLKEKKILFISIFFGLLIALPAFLILLSPQGRQRFSGVSIFSNKTVLLSESVKKLEFDRQNHDPLADLFHNRRVIYVLRFVEGYLWSFSPDWLFLNGDGDKRHHAPDAGMLYLFELPFILLGIFLLLREKAPVKYLIFAWFLLAALPAAPTNPVPHAVRTYYFLPIYQVFSALGLWYFWKKTKYTNKGKLLLGCLTLFAFFNVSYYLQMYHGHLSKEYSESWQYGYQEAINEVLQVSPQYEKIVFSNKLEQPYIFFLFYTKYNPQQYLARGGSTKINFDKGASLEIDKYEFKPLDWANEKKSSKILYIGKPADFSGDVKIIKTINYLDGKPAIVLVEG